MKRTLVLCTLAVALSGCAAISDLPPGYTLAAQSGEGLAVVSLTLSGRELDQVSSFEYRVREAVGDATEEVSRSRYFDSARQQARWLLDKGAQGPAAKRVRLIVKDQALAEPLDIVDAGAAIGRLAVLRLPPGEYELYDWKVVMPNRYGGDVFSPKRALGHRFRIEAGHATYLGNVDLRLTGQDTYKIAVEDKATRDLALLAEKLPSVRADEILQPRELRP